MSSRDYRSLLAFGLGVGLLALGHEASAQSPLHAGGLAPPPPGSAPPRGSQPTETERLLQEADEADSGRGLEVAYFDIEVGGQFVDLEAFGTSGRGLLPSVAGAANAETSGFAPSFGVGAGARLLFWTIGPRFRYSSFSDWDLWTLGGEVGVHIPLGNFEPYIALGAGYAKLGHPTSASFGRDSGVSVDGMSFNLSGGADYFLTPVFSIGARAHFDALFLKRASVSPTTLTTAASGPEYDSAMLYGEAGSGVGFGASGSLVLGLHF